jgi:hypothetical protein
MTEDGFRMSRDIILNLMPVIAVIANLFAISAYRQKPLQSSEVRDHLFKLEDATGKFGFQPHDSLADFQSGAKLIEIERLGYVIIRARLESRQQVFSVVSGCQKNYVSGLTKS